MKISLKWLEDFVDFSEKDPQKIAAVLTEKSAEIDKIISLEQFWENIVVGEIIKISSIPKASKIRLTEVKIGKNKIQKIICGAKNIEVGQKVPVALPGAILPGNFKIEKRKILGVESCGMICSSYELGISEESEGILVLSQKEKIGTSIAKISINPGVILEIDNTAITNRPDLFSHLGFAREIVATGLGKWKKIPPEKIDLGSEKNFPLNVKITPSKICPYWVGIILNNIEIKKSPDWLAQKLESCGIRSISNIVDITNFVMLELGMPLHAFDLEKISGKNITMRLSKKNEKIETLDGKQQKLPENSIILEDDKKIFDLCGIMGGKNSEISNETKKILLHAPIYDSILIRRTANFLAHRTDAATIYEKNIPLIFAEAGMQRAVELIFEVCPQVKISAGKTIGKIPSSKKIKFPKDFVQKILGINISEKEIGKILENLEFKIIDKKNSNFTVEIPQHRNDINIPEDLAEEIVRIFGLEKIPSIAPKIQIKPNNRSLSRKIRDELSNFFVSHNFLEILNLAFCSKKLLKKSGEKLENLIEIQNPISEFLEIMRPSLLPEILEKSQENRRFFEKFRFFEIGKIFQKEKNKIKENESCCGILVGENYETVKGILEKFFYQQNLEIKFTAQKNLPISAQNGADIFLKTEKIGSVFKIPNNIIKNFDLPEICSGFSLNLEEIKKFSPKVKKIISLPKFPGIELDISVLVPKKLPANEILEIVKNLDERIYKAEIIEIFEGEKIASQKKSVTLHFEFRHPQRTLQKKEMEELRDKILKKLAKNKIEFRF